MKKKAAKKAVATRRQKVISITPDLLARLDQYGDVNWSAVACQAFEIKLGELASQKETKDMSDVIARLRASKLKAQSEEFANGFEHGEQWAREYAEVPELERIEAMKTKLDSNNYWEDFFTDESSAYTAAELFFEATTGENGYLDRAAAAEFFEVNGASDEQQGNPQFVRGFAEGALSQWATLKEQI